MVNYIFNSASIGSCSCTADRWTWHAVSAQRSSFSVLYFDHKCRIYTHCKGEISRISREEAMKGQETVSLNVK